MSWWWPFGRPREHGVNQQQQIDESTKRITQDGAQKIARAKERLTVAATEAKEAADRHMDESTPLMDALKTLIDRQSHGRYNLSKGGPR